MNDQEWSYLTASKHQEYNNTRRNTRRRRVGRSVWNIIKKMFPFQKPTSEGFILQHFNFCIETWHFCNKI